MTTEQTFEEAEFEAELILLEAERQQLQAGFEESLQKLGMSLVPMPMEVGHQAYSCMIF